MIFLAHSQQRSSRIPNWDAFLTAGDLRDAILRLEESRRLVYCLVYLEQLTLEEIAVVLERPEDEVAALFYWAHVDLGTIESPFQRARVKVS